MLDNNKQLPKIFLIFQFLCMFFIISPVYSSDPEKINLTAFDYPPFYFDDGNGLEGIAVDIVDELCKRMKIKAVLKNYPLKRALNSLNSGSSDGMMILIRNSEREEYLHFSVPVCTARGFIWSLAEEDEKAVEFSRFEDLLPYKIGITAGYSYGEKFDEFLKKADTEVANTDYNNYKKLMAGRIDIFPGNYFVAKGIMNRDPELKGKFIHSEKSFIEWDLCMAVSKKSSYSSRLEEINRIIKDLIAEGFIDKAVRKYTE